MPEFLIQMAFTTILWLLAHKKAQKNFEPVLAKVYVQLERTVATDTTLNAEVEKQREKLFAAGR